ncbi:MAG: hypothetical protein RIR11_2243 [Bacteroidota bacterium]
MKNVFLAGKPFKLSAFYENETPTYAYAVNAKGLIVDKQLISKDGEFYFEPKNEDGLRLLIAPEPKGAPIPKSLNDLEKAEAYQPVLRQSVRSKFQEVAAIPSGLASRWIYCHCRVRGKLQKQFCFSFPGLPPFFPNREICFSRPVCNARVHVCRVKPRIFQTLPAADIFRIRDRIIELPKKWPFPIPEPEPIREIFREGIGAAQSTVTSAFDTAKTVQASAGISPLLLAQLQTNSVELLRTTISQNISGIQPWLPYLDICSLLYTCEEIFVTDVDCDGRFDEGFWHRCGRDENLYFWVEYLFDGQWVTVYRPRLCSGTYWNFECGDEITLTLKDPRVSVCQPVKSRFMYVTRIGNSGYLPRIDQNTGLLSYFSADDGTVTTPSENLQRPFGGNLALWCDFGSELPEAATATHYRISYKDVAAADIESNWNVINNDVLRTYAEEIDDPILGTTRSVYGSFNLRDAANPGFYIIPENEASTQPGIVDPVGYVAGSREWYYGTEFVIANWDTSSIPQGNYHIRIQLCKTVGGTLQPVAVRRELFQTPKSLSELFTSDLAPNDHLYDHTSDGNARGLLIRLSIDNRSCTSGIDNAEVNGTAADANCGLLSTALTGTLTARLGFTAAHPGNKGTFHFSMVRGNGNTTGLEQVPTSGIIGENPAYNGYILTGDNYHRDNFDANGWLSASSCANGAAFAENLAVKAMATDGTHRLQNYDAPFRTAAFAIIKDCDCAE